MAVFERPTPRGWVVGVVAVVVAWGAAFPLLLIAWAVSGAGGRIAEVFPVHRLGVELTFFVALLLACVIPFCVIVQRVRRRYGRAEVYPQHVAFAWALSGSAELEQVALDDLWISEQTPWGLACRTTAGRSRFRTWVFPLFIPAQGKEQERCLRLLQGQGQRADWTPQLTPARCEACSKPFLRRGSPRTSCLPCARKQGRLREWALNLALITFMLVILGLLLVPLFLR